MNTDDRGQPDFSVIVLNYNDGDDLLHCLESLRAASSRGRFEVIVIDNASTDGSIEEAEKLFPDIRITRNKANLGVARARNQGLSQARGEYLVFLDVDAEVREDALAILFEYMRTHPDVAVAGPKLIYPGGSLQYSCRTFPTPTTFLLRGLRASERTPVLKAHLMVDCDRTSALAVDWVMGACQMIRRSAIEEIGVLDENYFHVYEDIDFCYRAWKKGWKVSYVPTAVVMHHYRRRSAHGGLLNPLKWRHAWSALRFFVKRLS